MTRKAYCGNQVLLVRASCGGGKTNSVPQNMNAPFAPMGEVHPLLGLARLIWPEAFEPRILSLHLQMADAEKMAANWNVRGAWRDWQGLAAKPNGAPQC